MAKNNKKKKKDRVIYIDDGSTIADMSGTSRPNPILGGRYNNAGNRGKRRGTAREQWSTYKTAVRQMFMPMLVVMGILTVAFGVMYLILKYGV